MTSQELLSQIEYWKAQAKIDVKKINDIATYGVYSGKYLGIFEALAKIYLDRSDHSALIEFDNYVSTLFKERKI